MRSDQGMEVPCVCCLEPLLGWHWGVMKNATTVGCGLFFFPFTLKPLQFHHCPLPSAQISELGSLCSLVWELWWSVLLLSTALLYEIGRKFLRLYLRN